MRRTINLQSTFYHKKYKEIYRLLFTADLEEVSDFSNWHKKNPDYIDLHRPLWIVVESEILNKRIWITHDFGKLGIETARLDLDCNTREYSESHERKAFKNQGEMAEYLRKLLRPCIEESIFLENDIDFDNEEILYDEETNTIEAYLSSNCVNTNKLEFDENIDTPFYYDIYVSYHIKTKETTMTIVQIKDDDTRINKKYILNPKETKIFVKETEKYLGQTITDFLKEISEENQEEH
ncbi:MAG: hypothetical protein Q4G09_00225 [Clostridia bacterium]|nr:hypothetical protein [Clostridia bacterium]